MFQPWLIIGNHVSNLVKIINHVYSDVHGFNQGFDDVNNVNHVRNDVNVFNQGFDDVN
jgi:hypothetical protein